MTNLAAQFGNIDIYLFDQLLRGNIAPGMRVIDAGCGGGRNLIYLLREGYGVFGVDTSAEAIGYVQSMAAVLAPGLPAINFCVEPIESMTFSDSFADAVICNSVLHFAKDDAHFDAMLTQLWRVLRPGGIFFCRLASTIGSAFLQVEGRRFLLPGGVEWYLVDEAMLMEITAALGGELLDPLKTTVVQGSRCMTTWVVRKLV
jgi:SAM-dependent methyltransferase